jgi:hypothetical protein
MNAQNPKIRWVVWLVAFCLVASFALADAGQPQPPNEQFSIISTSHRIEIGSLNVPALAGNVTELSLNTTFTTYGWQGYYGDVSGTIVLDDALNNTMYSWALTDPEGEVFASRNTTINWDTGNIVCATSTETDAEEVIMSFDWGGVESDDGIDETFVETTHPPFWVAGNEFTADECDYTVSTYVEDTVDPIRAFNETILYSTSDAGVIFAALIHPGGNNGFKIGADDYDFQMLVTEDGHEGDLAPTDYYFWVELE